MSSGEKGLSSPLCMAGAGIDVVIASLIDGGRSARPSSLVSIASRGVAGIVSAVVAEGS